MIFGLFPELKSCSLVLELASGLNKQQHSAALYFKIISVSVA